MRIWINSESFWVFGFSSQIVPTLKYSCTTQFLDSKPGKYLHYRPCLQLSRSRLEAGPLANGRLHQIVLLHRAHWHRWVLHVPLVGCHAALTEPDDTSDILVTSETAILNERVIWCVVTFNRNLLCLSCPLPQRISIHLNLKFILKTNEKKRIYQFHRKIYSLTYT